MMCNPKRPGSIGTGAFWKKRGGVRKNLLKIPGYIKKCKFLQNLGEICFVWPYYSEKILVVNEQICIFHTRNASFLIHLIPGTASLRNCPSYR